MARPNILLVVADDLGFSDVGCFGSEINTPNIDKLAAEGIRMTDFHTAAACSPTRSMLLTGTDNHIAGVGVMNGQKYYNVDRWNAPGHEGYLNFRVAALPELLQDGGYTTLMSGKWHLGLRTDQLPGARGFDRSFTLLPGCANHYGYEPQFQDEDMIRFFEMNGPLYTEDDVKADVQPNKTNDPSGFYSTDTFTDKMLGYLADRPDKNKPFFGYLAYSSPHWPLQVGKEWRDKYKGVYSDGPEALRQRRLANLKKSGLIPEHAVAHDVVASESSEWEQLTDEQKQLSARAMETYAGMVENLDWNIGRVLEYLEKTGERENTLVVFMSDNGAEGASLEAWPTMGGDLMQIVRKYHNNSLENIGEFDSYVWYGPRWAQASTAPSRLYKMFSTEGGIRVPFVLNYAPWTKSKGGSVLKTFATVMDLAPTILQLANIQHPTLTQTQFRGRDVEPIRGKSWVEFFENGIREPDGIDAIHTSDDPAVGWELFGRAALRKGKWKILFMPTWSHGSNNWELFDLDADPGETNNLAEKEPEKLAELIGHWDTYVKETGVVWGPPLKPGPVDVDMTAVIGGDPLDDTRAWMPPTRAQSKRRV